MYGIDDSLGERIFYVFREDEKGVFDCVLTAGLHSSGRVYGF
jgi:hypothetical protein